MKRVILPFLVLAGTFLIKAQNTPDVLTDEMRKELKAEIKEELRAELEAELKQDLQKAAATSIDEESFLKKVKDLVGSRIKFSGKALIRLGEFDMDQEQLVTNKSASDFGSVYTAHNRYWSRYNFYLNIDAMLTEQFSLHARVRTGHQQYSFVTFGGSQDDRLRIMLDEFWLKWQKGKYEAKIGRQGAGSVWKNQKGSQFDIPTHDGITVGATYDVGGVKIKPQLAYFDEYYRNNTTVSGHGRMYGYSVTASKSSDKFSWLAQTGMINANDLPTLYKNDLTGSYFDGDLAPDYHILTNHLEVNFKKLKNLGLSADVYYNLKNYDSNPTSRFIADVEGDVSFTNTSAATNYNNATAPDFTDEKFGYVVTLSLGDANKEKSIAGGVSYLYLEKYAAMDYFAQYDYARWASTNIKGPEFFVSYKINKFMNFKTRYFMTEEIKGLNGVNPDFKRSADRVRFDINITF